MLEHQKHRQTYQYEYKAHHKPFLKDADLHLFRVPSDTFALEVHLVKSLIDSSLGCIPNTGQTCLREDCLEREEHP